jgi:hypothetical protein
MFVFGVNRFKPVSYLGHVGLMIIDRTFYDIILDFETVMENRIRETGSIYIPDHRSSTVASH